ncbi:hypothetical protein FNV43_RR20889 [Rhamnella rubrinervis]|uniref:Uncharacterized protein n=1 Tax=Rhamnella rubrinervis TaxID=2594499 RepID=A0A8K0GUZ4_9ROSA|nr:hypothetical protein FNV43_RR20889 [Rhamnella rubrinervis]
MRKGFYPRSVGIVLQSGRGISRRGLDQRPRAFGVEDPTAGRQAGGERRRLADYDLEALIIIRYARADMKDQKQRRYERLGATSGYPLVTFTTPQLQIPKAPTYTTPLKSFHKVGLESSSERSDSPCTVTSVFGAGKAGPFPIRPGGRRPARAGSGFGDPQAVGGLGLGPVPTTEPILFEFWIHFADFPCLHCSIDGHSPWNDAVMSAAGRGDFGPPDFQGRERCGHRAASRCSSGRWTTTSGGRFEWAAVRLVFRPYTQVRRAICRVDIGCGPPSFLGRPSGIVHHLWVPAVCSHSNRYREDQGDWWCNQRGSRRSASLPYGFTSGWLRYMSDSLVRVSRRANGNRGRQRALQSRRGSARQPRSRRQRLPGMTTAGLGRHRDPRRSSAESIGGPALTVPHPAERIAAPFASLPTISSTL